LQTAEVTWGKSSIEKRGMPVERYAFFFISDVNKFALLLNFSVSPHGFTYGCVLHRVPVHFLIFSFQRNVRKVLTFPLIEAQQALSWQAYTDMGIVCTPRLVVASLVAQINPSVDKEDDSSTLCMQRHRLACAVFSTFH
jgi:hypothetical protein